MKEARRFIASVKRLWNQILLKGIGQGRRRVDILVCMVHNIKKIYAKIVAKGGELDGLTRELQAVYNPASLSRMSFQLKYEYGGKN